MPSEPMSRPFANAEIESASGRIADSPGAPT